MNKLFSLLGLAQRAGKLVSGEEGVQVALHKRQAFCLLIAADSSENTKRRFLSIAENNRVPVYVVGTKERLGQAIGKSQRALILILDTGFAQAIQDFLADYHCDVPSGRKIRSDADEEDKNL